VGEWRPPRFQLLRIMLANALLLSAVYLGIGLAVEILLLFFKARWLDLLSLSLDSLPARMLAIFGWLDPLAAAAAYGRVSGFWLRAIFGVTTVTIIFALALIVGLVMAGASWLMGRRRA